MENNQSEINYKDSYHNLCKMYHEAFTSLFRANSLLSDIEAKNEKLEQQLKEANEIVFKLAKNGVDLSVHTEAREYLTKWREK